MVEKFPTYQQANNNKIELLCINISSPKRGRVTGLHNPADFELTNFLTINNASIPVDWEEETNGKCWDELEPILKQIGEYAFAKTEDLKTHPDFELSVNGRQDWYEFIWRK